MSDPVALLTLPEAAERLRLSRRTVERLIDAGRIRPVRIGRRVLVTEREIAAFVAQASGRRVA
jgi:excisionase family DNA binding protein